MKRRLPVTGLHEAFSPQTFADEETRSTVQMLLFYQRGLLLVQPKKAPEGWYVPPQEGVEVKDQNLAGTFDRGIAEEVKLHDRPYFRSTMLGGYLNATPPERHAQSSFKYKRIYCVAARLRRMPDTLPDEENAHHVMVRSWAELDEAMTCVAEARGLKYVATCIAVRKACRAGICDWPV